MVWRARAGQVPRVQPAHRRAAALLLLFLAPVILSGCLGAAETAPPDADSTRDTVDPGLVLLARPRLELRVTGGIADLTIHLEGDPTTVTHHEIEWGDGQKTGRIAGPPPNATSHEYPTPSSFRADPHTYRITVTILGRYGHETASTDVFIGAPPNRPPDVRLEADTLVAPLPGRITFIPALFDVDGDLRSWTFQPGDGTAPITGLGAIPDTLVHLYRTIGNHSAVLTATDSDGNRAEGRQNVTILPPHELHVWTFDTDNGTAIRHDPNGTVVARSPIRPDCGTRDCSPLVDAETDGRRLYVLADDPAANRSILSVLDGKDGTHLRDHELPPHPVGIETTQTHVWTTHGNGALTWTPLGGGPSRIHLPKGAEAPPLVSFSADGAAWAVHPGPASQVTRIHPGLSTQDPFPLLLPTRGVLLASNHKHDAAVLVDDQARAWVLTAAANGPTVSHIGILSNTTALPRGIVCPHKGDLCWVALDGPDVVTAFDITHTSPLPAGRDIPLKGHDLLGLIASGDRLVVAVGGKDAGAAIIDTRTDSVTLIASATETAPLGMSPHAAYPHLVYHMDREAASWGILDTTKGVYAHHARETGGTLGPLLVPERNGASR